MATARLGGPNVRQRWRWSFADCIFDEANWALSVAGRRVAIEAKPLELLRELLRRAGSVVSKDELLDAIWPDVMVVEASLPTAARKLRLALRDDGRKQHIIETVAGIGYRLAVPVVVEEVGDAPPTGFAAKHPLAPNKDREVGTAAVPTGDRRAASMRARFLPVAGGMAIAFALLAFALAPPQHLAANRTARSFSEREATNALRKLDVRAIEGMLAAGWDPNTTFDDQGNGAINYVLNICEWDRDHNQEQMVLMVRTLIDGGARLDHRNVWGDTPYSIAKAQRYCGPNHRVTRSIRAMCYNGYRPLGDRCLATYELARRSRRGGRASA